MEIEYSVAQYQVQQCIGGGIGGARGALAPPHFAVTP